jgi:hypothetical protein
MPEESPAQKAAKTRKRRSAAKKAVRTKTARKVAGIVKNRQWDKGIVRFLEEIIAAKTDTHDHCMVCNDERQDVLEIHHVNRERTETITLCANCHQLVTHGNIDELRKACKSTNN